MKLNLFKKYCKREYKNETCIARIDIIKDFDRVNSTDNYYGKSHTEKVIPYIP